MTSIAQNASQEFFLKAKLLEDDAYDKNKALVAADKHNHHHTYLSQAADGQVTSAGRILQGAFKKRDEDRAAFFASTTANIFALMFGSFNESLAANSKFIIDKLASLSKRVMGPTPYAHNNNIDPDDVTTQYASKEFKAVVANHIAGHVETAAATAPDVFNALSAEYMVPFNANIVEAFQNSHGNEAVALHNIQIETLRNNGVCFSQDHDKHVMCAVALDKLRTEYDSVRGNSSLGNHAILAFNGVTNVTTPNLPNTNQGLRSLELAPVRISTREF